MSKFLDRLRALDGEKCLPWQPSKPSKGAFEGFEGYRGKHISGRDPAPTPKIETNFRTDTRARDDRPANPFIDIRAHLARAHVAADRRNWDCERAELTDRFCDCGQLATLAYPDSDSRQVWLCLDCQPAAGRE